MANYFTLITTAGLAKITNAQLTNSKVEITEVVVGDGNGSAYTPTGTESQLKRVVWRGGVTSIEVDSQNPNWIVADAVIPATAGGFTIREVGLYDVDGTLIAIGNYPDTYKPVLADGSTMDLSLRTIIEVSNASSVTLRIDPNVIVASRKYVDDKVSTLDERVTAQLAQTELKLAGVINAAEFGIESAATAPVVGNSDSLQAMINELRQVAINSNLEILPTVQIPGGRYILDKEVHASPYLAFESLGKVIFDIQHNGTGILIAPFEDDPIFLDHSSSHIRLQKNSWNRGEYFIGKKKSFEFISTTIPLDENNRIIGLEVGSRNPNSPKQTPISRYNVSQLSFYGLHASIKLNTTNHYIGTFNDTHSEFVHHHVIWGDETGMLKNSGENFNFRGGVFGIAQKEGFLFNVGGIDITFTDTSLDFNQDKLFYVRDSGVYIRLNMGYTEKISDSQRFYVAEPRSEGAAFGRNGLYFNNYQILLANPKKMIENKPHIPSNRRINLSVHVNGLEVRYDEVSAIPVNDVALIDTSENISIFGKYLIVQNDQRCILSKGLNIVANGDFSKSTIGTNVSTENDTYWTSTTANVSVVVGANGVGGSNSLNMTVLNTSSNSARVTSKLKYNAQPGQIVSVSPSIKIANAKNTMQVNSTVYCYDGSDTLIDTLTYYGFLTNSTTNQTFGDYYYPRFLSKFQLPSGTVKITPSFVVVNAEYDYSINDIQVMVTG